jgi:endonuclease/exonuclease/phosphatase family metal-dependent hydrolase
MLLRKLFRILSLMIITAFFWSGCDDDQGQTHTDPCEGITCSQAGTCVQENTDQVRCECDSGYHPQELECILDDMDPIFTSTPATEIEEGSTYLYPLVCTDPQSDQLTLSIEETDSCGGNMVDNGDGTGTYTFNPGYDLGDTTCMLSISCTDSSGLEAIQSVDIHITDASTADIITNLPTTETTHWGRSGSFLIEANNDQFPANELEWTITNSNCTFEPTVDASGLVSWTCGDVDTCSIAVKATHTISPDQNDTQAIAVSCTNTAPQIISQAPLSVLEGMHYRYPVSCQDTDGDGVALFIDSSTDTCDGTLMGTTYSFASTDGMGGTSCFAGIICSDAQVLVKQNFSVDIEDFSEDINIRIVAGNLSSSSLQNFDLGHGIRLLQALLPDIVLVQEMNYLSNSSTNYRAFSNSIIGNNYFAVDNAGFQIPNGVISRWPILESGYWDDPSITNRELLWAVIDLPGLMDLFVISVHLHTSPVTDQIAASQIIINEVKAHQLSHPDKYYYIVGGDFNGPSTVSTDGFGMDDTFAIETPFPVDDNGNYYTNAPRSSHYDYILVDPTMSEFQIPVVFQSNLSGPERTYMDGFVFDTRTFTQEKLNEYFPPALTTDSQAIGMQHMAVVKDYLLK